MRMIIALYFESVQEFNVLAVHIRRELHDQIDGIVV